MRVFGPVVSVLERGLDVRLGRQNVLATNLANIDTPDFRPADVDVARAMDASASTPAVTLARTAEGHVATSASPPGGGLPLTDAAESRPGLDGNGVDLDRTMAALAENAVQYAATARVTTRHLALLRYVASDGTA